VDDDAMNIFDAWVTGNLSPETRVFAALLPAMVAMTYFLGGYACYAVRCAIWGESHDREAESRGRSALMGYHLRNYFVWVTRPIFRLVLASGVPAMAITYLAALLGIAAGAAIAAGRFAIGGWLFLFSGIMDTMDGRLARQRNEVTPAGAAVDSVLDRYVDTAMLIGLGWYYRESWVLLLVLFAMLGTSVVPYIRAKGEGLGVAIKDGVMQRAERMLYLGGAVAVSPIFEAVMFPADRHPTHYLAIAGIAFLAVTTNLTAVSRFRHLVGALGSRP
jgi:phosphatidylglycerophosphate synthase